MKVFNNPMFENNNAPNNLLSNSRMSGHHVVFHEILANFDDQPQSDQFGFQIEDVSSNEQSRKLEWSNISLSKSTVKGNLMVFQIKYIFRFLEQSLYESALFLKKKVITLLEKYQKKLEKVGNDSKLAKQIRKQIRKDAKTIQDVYTYLIQLFLTNTEETIEEFVYREREDELNKMFNLVEEFLHQFLGRNPNMNNFTQILNQKIKDSKLSVDDSSRYSMYDMISADSLNQVDSTKSQCNEEHLQKIDAKLQEEITFLSQNEKNSKIVDSITSILGCNDSKKIAQTLESFHTNNDIDHLSVSRQLVEQKIKQLNSNLTISYNPKRDKQRQKFFDLALSMKNTLEPDHPSKKILVSKLFEEAQEAGIRENEWKIWLNEKLE